MHLVRHLRRAPYESPAAPMSNNATDFVFSTGSKYARIIRSQVEIRCTLVLREWTGRRTLFLPARNCKLVVQSFAASDDTTTGTGGRERARETGKLQMERKKETPFCTCITLLSLPSLHDSRLRREISLCDVLSTT